MRKDGKIVDFKKRPASNWFRQQKPKARRTFRMPVVWRQWRTTGVILLLAIVVVGGREVLAHFGFNLAGKSSCHVVRVVDGDTVRVFCPGRGVETARLLGFDAPEVYSPRCLGEWWAGMRATWALQRQIWFSSDVDLVFRGTDRYGRRLALLTVDGRNIAGVMIEDDHARAYAGGARAGWC